MSIKLSADKAFTYLKSRLFPWNFLLEPVDGRSIEHYIKLAMSRAVGALKKESDIKLVFASKVREVAGDFLRNCICAVLGVCNVVRSQGRICPSRRHRGHRGDCKTSGNKHRHAR